MNNAVKIGLYIGLVILAAISGFFSMSRFKEMMNTDRSIDVEIEKEKPAAVETPPPEPSPTPTNPTPVTNLVSTNAEVLTNLAAIATNLATEVAATATNAPLQAQTNPPAQPAIAKASEDAASANEVPTAMSGRAGGKPSGKRGGVGLWMALFVLSLIGLGILIASDVSQYFGNRALKTLYNEDAEGIANPEYEAAEQVWANGKHLEAIRMMREYLNKNPREQFVALRIAEIYEKDLGNYLAAALEYEEVLKHKLPAERWGWAAIHLCNLYFKLGQEEKGFALLRRLVKEHPETGAAEKARKRLGEVDGLSETTQELTEEGVKAAPVVNPAEDPNSNLPPGFRKKK
jgi:tetratricopeptide (TPR) repeat protein